MNIFSKLFMDGDWNIAFRNKSANSLIDYEQQFISLPHNKEYWFADPMGFDYKDKSYLFCEAFDRKNFIGKLGVFEIRNGEPGNFRIILSENYHLSYPCVFTSKDGKVYMIPESGENLSLDLYVAEDFPYKWKKLKTLITGKNLADTTVFSFNNEYWFYSYEAKANCFTCYLYKLELVNYTVSLYCSKDFDNNNCRSGGYFISVDNKIICPIQDCRGMYGKSIIFNEFTIEAENFESKEIFSIDNEKIKIDGKNGVDRLHTYSSTKSMEFIDYNNFHFSLFKRLNILKRKSAINKRQIQRAGINKCKK